ncbi:uncharacterized protein LY79DRAFT_62277 [Colletotrichum navitas]|uniref:BZIP domain-containing protein n=1 Tax=Colletotrichum navitas TaxID=681940 RepID=A0AAD8Q5P5_9PEZI|nr:uncharacterized protein LY79DRAFT_62277 [Colletotrichum navitas]KAK1596362.1 hypothetical protein LY79DRAFT_62277 [Colletotrichum navitas]
MEAEKERSRIRDNQRRSRARKKEYVLEIEQKLRDCQSQGVEASAEVQQAARRVANENHKLRQLLCTLGLVDRQIEQYIKTGELDPSIHNLPLDVHESRTAAAGQEAAALESLLVPRWPACLQNPLPFVPGSRSGSTDRTITYGPASNSSAEDYGPSAEDVHQSYGLMSASPVNLNPSPIYPQPAHPQTHEYGSHQLSRENVQYAESSHSQTSHGPSLNPPGYDPNQTFDYRPIFSAGNPLIGHPLPTCCGPPAAPYVVYHPSHQQPISYVTSRLGSSASNTSRSASVADADFSIEERASQQTGNPDDNAWLPKTHFNRVYLERRNG